LNEGLSFPCWDEGIKQKRTLEGKFFEREAEIIQGKSLLQADIERIQKKTK
jgi:hypothetical protein